MNASVSIIIPTYNRAHFLAETLNSVLSQTYGNWECIVIDDGSTDHTTQMINGYTAKDPRFLYFERPDYKKKGPSSARNYGLEKATGAYVIFLDSDDLLQTDCLRTRVHFAQKYPNHDFFIFKTQLFRDRIGDSDQIFNMVLPSHADEAYLDLLLKGKYPFCVSSPMWKTAAVKSIGGFDENLSLLEDPDFHIKAFAKGLKSTTDSNGKPDNYYRKSGAIQSKSEKHIIEATYYFIKKYLPQFKQKMKPFCIGFYKSTVLEKGTISQQIRIYWHYVTVGLLTARQIFVIPLLLLYKFTSLDTAKGLGFYTIRKQL